MGTDDGLERGCACSAHAGSQRHPGDGYGGPSGFRLGLRLPGTHIPFVVAAGTFLKAGDRQFVFTRRKLHTIVIELADHEWTRLVIGVPDAHAAAARINAAVARLRTNAD
ncbi:MAG: hypothetical protein RR983_11945 [Massilia sp.]|uniref:hypothetical protein n=1 Tax=Massilia sp. TaxID=1882437 RepID=UPI002FC891AF